MDKSYRGIIKPTQDFFVELDFNAAELRMMLALLGKTQPYEDLHLWNSKNIFKNKISRDDAKAALFAWLYNPIAQDSDLEAVYNKSVLVNKFWDGKYVTTMFNRKIPSDRFHALNYILQSYTALLVLCQALRVYNFLDGKRSFISFMIHDNVVIDMAEEERHLIEEMVDVFSNTIYGKFLVNISVGENAGDLEEV